MNATELRIGNYISFIDRTREVHIPQTHPLKVYNVGVFKIEVCQIDEHFAQVEKMIVLENLELTPIPLTEEWLLKFGLLKTKESMFLLGCYCLIAYEDSYRVLLPKNGILTTIKYVHKLQNLYFELKGEELTIKE